MKATKAPAKAAPAKGAPPAAAKKAAPPPAPAPAKKAAPAPKAKAEKPAPLPKGAKAQPKTQPKPEPVAKAQPKATPAPKAAKPAVEKVEKRPAPEKPPKPVKPPKAAKAPKPPPPPKPSLDERRPLTSTPSLVRTGPAPAAIGLRPITMQKATPKPLAAPKPLAPEVVGETQPVPVFKGKASSGGAVKNLVLVGAIAGAFGVKGEARLRAFTATKEGIISYGPLYDEDGKVVLRPKSWRELRDGVAVVAPEIKSKEQADSMRGKRLYVPRANLPQTADDEFYIVDLLGCRAEALDGAVLGEVVAVWNFGAGDVLEVRPPNGGPTSRISFTKETVPMVDLPGKRIVIDPPAPEEPAGK